MFDEIRSGPVEQLTEVPGADEDDVAQDEQGPAVTEQISSDRLIGQPDRMSFRTAPTSEPVAFAPVCLR